MSIVFDSSLALYLPLHQLDGTSFMSADAHGHACSVTCALWRPKGRYFDGTDDKISCGNIPALSPADALTWECWLRCQQALSEYSDNSTVCRKEGEYTLDIEAASDRLSGFVNAGGGWNCTYIEDGEMGAQVWHHVCYTYDGTAIKIFLNGELVRRQPKTGTINATSNELWLGCTGGSGRWWYGFLGEVRLYRRALALPEIQHNYMATKGRYR